MENSIDFSRLKFLVVLLAAMALTIAAMTHAAVRYYAVDPVLVVLPIPVDGEEGRPIPIALPPGRYVLQIGLRADYLERIEQVEVSGVIGVGKGLETRAAREVGEVLDHTRISALLKQAKDDAEIAKDSAGDRTLPYPWTTVLPDTVAIPLFPPFSVDDRNEVLELETYLEVVDRPKAGEESRASGDVFLRIERYFDAL